MLLGIISLTGSNKDCIINSIINFYNNCILINSAKLYSLIFKDELFLAELSVKYKSKISREFLNNIINTGKEEEKKEINKIMSRYAIKIISEIKQNHPPYMLIIIDTITLLDFKINDICDKVIVLFEKSEIRAERLAKKLNIPYDTAFNRTSIQRPIIINKNNYKTFEIDYDITEDLKNSIFKFIGDE